MSTHGWSIETVEACLERLAAPSAGKLQTKDYRDSGKYPVIDQGQAFFAGWTDDNAAVISNPLPLIVFGDHTRAFKFIDFPFVRGADGTQLLGPREGIDPLYFYYACRAIDLPSRGYNRHFTVLKSKEVELAPPDEQEQIGRVLRRVESGIEIQNEQLHATQDLKRAAMRELFTRGLRGEAQKETEIGPVPESWQPMPISALGNVVTGNTPPTKDAANYIDGEIPFIAPGDFEHGARIGKTEKFITERGLTRSRPIKSGTTCFVCIGWTIGKVGYATEPVCATNQQINSIIPAADFNSLFVFYLMTFWADHVRQQASASPVPILSKGAFEQIEIFGLFAVSCG